MSLIPAPPRLSNSSHEMVPGMGTTVVCAPVVEDRPRECWGASLEGELCIPDAVYSLLIGHCIRNLGLAVRIPVKPLSAIQSPVTSHRCSEGGSVPHAIYSPGGRVHEGPPPSAEWSSG